MRTRAAIGMVLWSVVVVIAWGARSALADGGGSSDGSSPGIVNGPSQGAPAQPSADESSGPWDFNYFGIVYGPGLQNPSSFLPTPQGGVDTERPVQLKNYLTVGYQLTDLFEVSATGYALWVPVRGQQLLMRDPFLRFSDEGLVRTEHFNWYADIRMHLPVSQFSRDLDLLASVQTFHALDYEIPGSRFTVGANFSATFNYFGRMGDGDVVELYFAPNVSVQMTSTLALTLLYEMSAGHPFGDVTSSVYNEGTDFEPGVSWDVTPNLMFNPYLNIYTGDHVTWQTTSLGMMMSWKLI